MIAVATTICLAILTNPVLDLIRQRQTTEPGAALPGPTAKFDPSRDAAADISAAVAQAGRTRRHVILDVGGEWCSWCHTLDRFFAADVELRRLRDTHYVWLKVNFSTENTNDRVLRSYPLIKGYPHLFVLDANGSVLHSQDTSELERGDTYDAEKMRQFLLRWARK